MSLSREDKKLLLAVYGVAAVLLVVVTWALYATVGSATAWGFWVVLIIAVRVYNWREGRNL